ncbi:Acetyltransferase [Lachnellula subtilissima]|uniref:Acetyltransferase n=1 Tax=Lachnellula subtilissima TaxID=602034 RepID=A0A8H8RR28_9HELO|nr:Acetyltransferase [Lachnellula subtilissima]
MSTNALAILAMAAAYVQQAESMEEVPRFGIRPARSSDISLLESVERSAAQLFRTVNLGFLADGPTLDPAVLTGMAKSNHLWIAVNDWDQPIGFLGGETFEGNFHLVEVSVARDFQGRGVGKALMSNMMEQVRREGYKTITLTTYRDVSWNGYWYAKMGFVEVYAQAMGRKYLDIMVQEGKQGLDQASRGDMWMMTGTGIGIGSRQTNSVHLAKPRKERGHQSAGSRRDGRSSTRYVAQDNGCCACGNMGMRRKM